MLKTIMSLQVIAANELLSVRVFAADKTGNVEGGCRSKHVKPKVGRSKNKKLFKSQKSAKSRKKLSETRNSPNFDAKNNELSFLTPEARAAFNCLWLTFIKALILQHFNLECFIWIMTDTLGYAINDMLSQLAFETRSDGVVTKTDLGQLYPITCFLKKMIPMEI